MKDSAMKMTKRSWYRKIKGPMPDEPTIKYLDRIEESLGSVPIAELAEACREWGIGIDDLIYEIAASKCSWSKETIYRIEEIESKGTSK
jgi:hypothetical protein